MGAAAWTRELARSFRPGCTDSEARAAQRALALSGPSTASERTVARRSLRLAGYQCPASHGGELTEAGMATRW